MTGGVDALPSAAVTGLAVLAPGAASPEELAEALRTGTPVGAAPLAEPPGAVPAALGRRMDRLSRLAASCALAAASRAGLGGVPGERVAVAFGTTFGDLDGLLRFLDRADRRGPHLANPADFPNLVMGATAGHVGLVGGWRGPQFAACRPGAAGQEAVAWGLDRLADGDADAVVAASGDVASAAHHAARASGPPAGEVMAAVVLEAPAAARARGATVLARVAVVDPAAGALPPAIDAPLGEPWGRAPGDGIARLVAAILAVQGAFRPAGWPASTPRASVLGSGRGAPALVVRAV